MGTNTNTKETTTGICSQADRSLEGLYGVCVLASSSLLFMCVMGVHSPSSLFLLPWEAPTPRASMHSCPVIAPMLYCAEGRRQPPLLLPLPRPV